MDINRLRYFVVLCNSSSMREAAEHLHITQPALSKAMKLLEHELQERLFIPSGRRVLVTDKGRIIANRAKKALAELEKITEEDNGNPENRIRIGSFEVFTTYFMGEVVSKMLGDFQIQLRELTPGHLEEQISIGNVDIGITYLPIPNPKLDFIQVGQIEMGVFGIDRKFKKYDFFDLPFAVPITPIVGVPHKVKGLDGWPDDKFPRNVKYQVELMETALEFCRCSLAVAYLPKFVVDLHNRQLKAEYSLTSLSVPTKLKTTKQNIYVIKRKSDVEHAAFKKIASALRSL